jgi:hypothetical protein
MSSIIRLENVATYYALATRHQMSQPLSGTLFFLPPSFLIGTKSGIQNELVKKSTAFSNFGTRQSWSTFGGAASPRLLLFTTPFATLGLKRASYTDFGHVIILKGYSSLLPSCLTASLYPWLLLAGPLLIGGALSLHKTHPINSRKLYVFGFFYVVPPCGQILIVRNHFIFNHQL